MTTKKEVSSEELDVIKYGAEIPITVEYLKVKHYGEALNQYFKERNLKKKIKRPFAEQLVFEVNSDADR